MTGSLLYFGWILFFMRMRKELDYRHFDQSILNQNKTIQIVQGMQEIKLQNCETQMRWEWERIQVRFFKLSVKSLAIGQLEGFGSAVLNGLKNILLTFYTAKLVVDGEMTLGMMLAVSYITGTLNAQMGGVIGFMHGVQNAKISADRLAEIHNKDNEERAENFNSTLGSEKNDIVFDKVSFQYGGPRSEMIIKDFSLTIPKGITTAIVGASGSGKSTLLKLLLKSCEPTEGTINYGDANVNSISFKLWRSKFATVTQDSFIFSDTIARNIAIGEELIDRERMKFATKMANIREFIEGLPLEYSTKIGEDGVGISQGQKQRVLLARAMYKDPDILMLDEATNALDAKNEKEIVNNLNEFCEDKTVIVVAHRLSTVKHADQIIVLGKGEIIEKGTHDDLVTAKGEYYDLVKDQLSIG
jgi:ATP-binding cassette subfamily B protein